MTWQSLGLGPPPLGLKQLVVPKGPNDIKTGIYQEREKCRTSVAANVVGATLSSES